MQVIKSNGKWCILHKCTGKFPHNRHKPCGSDLIIEEDDIVKMEYVEDEKEKHLYGFICMKCNCFSSVSPLLIPKRTLNSCPIITTDNKLYSQLTVEEQVLSDKI